jgi:hypothetical protein
MRRRRTIALTLAVALTTGALSITGAVPVGAATTTHVEQRYAINATLDPALARLDAVEELTLTNRAAQPIDHVNVSVIPNALGYFTLGPQITVGGVPAEAAWTNSTNLRIALPGGLKRDATAAIVIPFRLDVGTSPEGFGARLSAENGVLSFGMWFPIVSREHDIYGLGDPQISFTAASIRLDLTTTMPMPRDAVACPGLIEAPEGSGTTWACEATSVRDFAFAVNPNFRLTERRVDDTALRVYTETVDGSATADLAEAGLIGLEEAFGAYPWPDLVVAEVGTDGGFSMEYPRQVHLTRSKVTDPYVVFHEVAHQWFYAQLGNDQMREPWVDEALADFSARYLMGIGEDACSTRDVDSTVFAWPAGATTGGDWTSCDGYFHTVFYRGSEFLNTVRDAMGAEAFFPALRALVEERRHGTVTGRRLLKHLDDASPVDLRPIYQQYMAGYRSKAIFAVAKGEAAA